MGHRVGGVVPGPRHSLQQLQQPLPILQPEVLRQILLFHDAQAHGGGDLKAQPANLHGETQVVEPQVAQGWQLGSCFSPPPAFAEGLVSARLGEGDRRPAISSSGCVGKVLGDPVTGYLATGSGSVDHRWNPGFAL